MAADELRRQAISLAVRNKLHEQTFLDVPGPTTDGLKIHYCLASLFDCFRRTSAHIRDLFEIDGQAPVLIEVSDDEFRYVLDIFVDREQIELPFEMFAKRFRMRKELFKTRSVVFMFNFLRAIA